MGSILFRYTSHEPLFHASGMGIKAFGFGKRINRLRHFLQRAAFIMNQAGALTETLR